ncbi:NADH-cytochrome b5 reductase 1 [Drosophila tropicalis]|uniref:NADH-cytochrome b5 reductase 1 n=1 Tax=Drosophila tropicalis TaxID=46794 RepID=UPI0035AB8EFE
MMEPPHSDQGNSPESDCCGNGCANCILDNKPKRSRRAQLSGQPNVILDYADFRLIHKEALMGDDKVMILHFAYAVASDNDDCILDIPPGHHVMLRIGSLLRPYSPFWTDFVRKEFKILVKLVPNGPMSQHLADLHINDVLQFRGPIGSHQHDAKIAKYIIIIAQGVAIAPTIPLVEEVLDNEDDMSRICHIVCARDMNHVYFRDRLLEFATYWNYQSCLYLPHQQCETVVCKEKGHCSQDCAELRKRLRYRERAKIQRFDSHQFDAHVRSINKDLLPIIIIAGDSSFQQSIKKIVACAEFPVSEENIYLL